MSRKSSFPAFDRRVLFHSLSSNLNKLLKWTRTKAKKQSICIINIGPRRCSSCRRIANETIFMTRVISKQNQYKKHSFPMLQSHFSRGRKKEMKRWRIFLFLFKRKFTGQWEVYIYTYIVNKYSGTDKLSCCWSVTAYFQQH